MAVTPVRTGSCFIRNHRSVRTRPQLPMSKVKVITESEFEKEVLQSVEPVMVKFGADWCKPCKVLAPVLETVAEEGHKVFEMDADECPDLTAKYKIKGLPTVLVFKDGSVVNTSVGVTSKANLVKLFE